MLSPSENKKKDASSWRGISFQGDVYTTGMLVSSLHVGSIYIRTDFRGIYKWDPLNHMWVSKTDDLAAKNGNMLSVDGFAISENKNQTIAAACGQLIGVSPSDLLISRDDGESWRRCGLGVTFGELEKGKMDGECVVFCPSDDSRILLGTRNDGMKLSSDGGQTWTSIRSLPKGTEDVGIRSVVFGVDPVNVYASVDGVGVYFSRDGGYKWHLIGGSPIEACRLAVDSNGNLFITAINPGGVFVYNGQILQDITPLRGRGYRALAVCRQRNCVLVASDTSCEKSSFKYPLFLSQNTGESWDIIVSDIDWSNRIEDGDCTHAFVSPACLAFDPHDINRVYLSDVYGIWTTDDIYAEPVIWSAMPKLPN